MDSVYKQKRTVEARLDEINQFLKNGEPELVSEIEVLQARLRERQQPSRDEALALSKEQSRLDRVLEVLKRVNQYRCRVRELFHEMEDREKEWNKRWNEQYYIPDRMYGDELNRRLESIFKPNCFVVYFYNKSDAGFYSNHGGPGDSNYRPYHEDEKTFCVPRAFEIATTKDISSDEKHKMLNELFDAFLK